MKSSVSRIIGAFAVGAIAATVTAAPASAASTCNVAQIADNIDWVVKRDPKASEQFWDDVRDGKSGLIAVVERLVGHDINAASRVARCEIESRNILAGYGVIS